LRQRLDANGLNSFKLYPLSDVDDYVENCSHPVLTLPVNIL